MRLGLALGLLLATGCGVDTDNDGVMEDVDCDDNNPLVYPNATEICDGLDNDCDTEVDENVLKTYFLDADGDGYGIEALTTEDCDIPEGYAGNLGDCDDYSAAVNPGEDDICDGLDNDCDDAIDENVQTTFYFDGDGDGVGQDEPSVQGCLESPPIDPNGDGTYVTESGDCDDSDPMISPNAVEICDELDNDCTGQIDDSYAIDAKSWYEDSDGDGYGSENAIDPACDQPAGYVDNTDDCDDTNVEINPDGIEICDGEDNDCNDEVDEVESADAITWYGDSDGDGYGGTTFSTVACVAPTSYVETSDDCDDLDANINPGATEVCDEVDNDCDNDIDDDDNSILYVDASGVDVLWYIDADSDSYGSSNFSLEQCNQPIGYVRSDDSSLDCNDLDDEINPGLEEVCDDGKDNNCDGSPTPCALEDELAYSDADTTLQGLSGKPSGSAEDGDQFGRSIAVGDFNGDGDDDLIVGASGVNDDNNDSGAAYVFFGPLSDTSMDADDAEIILWGDAEDDAAGYAVTAADLDGDGYDEMIVTAYGQEVTPSDSGTTELSDAGQVYVFYGSADAEDIGRDSNLSDDAAGLLSGTLAEGHFGCALANAGDINGDNRDDLLIGSCISLAKGAATLIYGSDDRFSDDTEVYPQDEAENETGGYAHWEGIADDDRTGETLSGLGDLNGDGVDDFGVGAYEQNVTIGVNTYEDAGTAYVILGDGTEHYGVLEIASAGAYFYGENEGDNAGISISGAGDSNDDGYDDFLVGASGFNLSSTSSNNGAAYIIYGDAIVNGQLSESAKIIGENQYDKFGDGVGMVGDIDDDGSADIALGAVTADGNVGAAYLFYGPVTGELDASDCDAKFTGNTEGDGEFGRVIVGPGDLNGDGELDMIIGAGADDGDGSISQTDVGGLYIFGGGGL